MVEIKGLEKFASRDFPGHISSTVFVGGCNFRCPFCHNADLVLNPGRLPSLDLNLFLSYLDSRKGWLDGLCLSGGEPLLQEDIEVLARVIKDRGYLVKLDTNGSFPDRLEYLIQQELVDWVAMDIKGPLARYQEIVRAEVDPEKIDRSQEIIRHSGLPYIFRTTVVPGLLTEADLKEIADWLRGARCFQLQQFVPQNTVDPEFLKREPYPAEVLRRWAEELRPFFDEVRLEGV
ncbi:MAG: anaerobic ribonucleoside-triphosphate reductase activating protein [Candidatus Saccharicenans sp.]|nr:anaerobic ribonucleoside-triphosphate reductase activating protein [Candidatus Saccharicenans sp.]MDH7492479.1 anaerobic ribonucleoside-triphosphate reductase activating protein [Candidatus Saccharicenans sp.]